MRGRRADLYWYRRRKPTSPPVLGFDECRGQVDLRVEQASPGTAVVPPSWASRACRRVCHVAMTAVQRQLLADFFSIQNRNLKRPAVRAVDGRVDSEANHKAARITARRLYPSE